MRKINRWVFKVYCGELVLLALVIAGNWFFGNLTAVILGIFVLGFMLGFLVEAAVEQL